MSDDRTGSESEQIHIQTGGEGIDDSRLRIMLIALVDFIFQNHLVEDFYDYCKAVQVEPVPIFIGIEQDGWLKEALRLDRCGFGARALDLVYDVIEGWLRDEKSPERNDKLRECDAFLDRLSTDGLPTRILLTIAVMTRPVSDKLKHREEFFERAWKTLESRGKDAEKLLGGLRVAAHLATAERPSAIKRMFGWH
ncbi:MAG: hypothetical protein ABSF29_13900 [Tepidisphaeraceae bacterium]|jgi:hypothetical protein